jgi:hypothetical protein
MPGDYDYDVFFSYKRHDLTLDWTRRVYKRFEFWLGEELGGRKARIFVDENCIETGDNWPQVLKDALKTSRCMVCVWSPSYFRSSWCVSEWMSFREREKIAGIASHGLIAPLRFHDGEHFPEDAQSTQWFDVAPYATTLPGFWETARAVDFEDGLKTFAQEVAQIVRGAPKYRPDWPVVLAAGLPTPLIHLEKL